jgi:hypothetical protein
VETLRKSDQRSKQNLRLEAKIWAAIDRACQRRPGSISRNTWITEAVLEKLARDEIQVSASESDEEFDD